MASSKERLEDDQSRSKIARVAAENKDEYHSGSTNDLAHTHLFRFIFLSLFRNFVRYNFLSTIDRFSRSSSKIRY